jgi:hypothetical protein
MFYLFIFEFTFNIYTIIKKYKKLFFLKKTRYHRKNKHYLNHDSKSHLNANHTLIFLGALLSRPVSHGIFLVWLLQVVLAMTFMGSFE